MKFHQTITYWYVINKREMPWRNTRNPYFIWLSEIILQQTQFMQGLPYYESFVDEFPTVFDLANADESDVLKLWQGLGYYSRARNLHATAKHITFDLNGKFPNNYKELLQLKGVGDYTASAIASICYNEPTAVVDGNVYRVLSRYFGIDTPINSTKGIKEFKTLAMSVMDKKHPADYNQAIMEFGAIQCKPSNPDCEKCPLNRNCAALEKKLVNVLPVKLKKTKVSTKYFNFLVFVSSDKKTIFQKRIQKGIWQNLYQFPLIETDKPIDFKTLQSHPELLSYTKNNAFETYLYNETDIIHKLSHQHLHTKFWIVEITSLQQEAIAFLDIKHYPTSILISNFIDAFELRL